MEDFVKPDFVSIGPLKQGLEARLTPHADGQPTRVVLSGARAYARYLLARELAENRYDNTSKQTLNHFDESLTKPFVAARQEVLTSLRHAGLSVKYDEAAVETMSELSGRIHARYSRWYPTEDEQGNITGWEFQPGTVKPADKAKAKAALDHLGFDKALFPFAYEGCQEILTKRDVLLAAPMGTGKSFWSLALAETWKYLDGHTTPTIILAKKRHLAAFREALGGVPEVKPFELLVSQYGPKCYEELVESSDRPTYTKPFVLVSLDRGVLLKDDQLAELQRIAATSTLIVDEGYVAQNKDTRLTKFLNKLQGAHHVMLTGTPIRSYVSGLFSMLNWVHRGGSVALPQFPSHRDGSFKKWNELFLSYAVGDDGSRKRTPIIKNAEQFWALLEPLMYRLLRNEPQVERVLGKANVEEERIVVNLSDSHMETYRAVLKQFIDWYQREIEARRKRGESAVMPEQEILVKLGYLVNNVRAPWRMEDHSDDEFKWPAHPRELTEMHKAALEIVQREVEEGSNVIVFGISVDAMELLTQEIAKLGISVGLMHGGVNQSTRDEIVRRSRTGEINVLVGTFGVLAEGLNLSSFTRAVIVDTSWDPSTTAQAIGRITRGIQEVPPKAYFIEAAGTIQQYMCRLNALKKAGIDAGLDRRKLILGADDIPDIRSYVESLVGVGAEDEIQERLFYIEEDAS